MMLGDVQMKKIIILAFMCFCFNTYANMDCVVDNSCEQEVSKHIAEVLGWDEVLDYFDGFEFTTKPIRSSNIEDAYISSFSNGSLTALLLSFRIDGELKLVSAIDVPNHQSSKLCNVNNDKDEDICLYGFPSGTNIAPYFASYIQIKGQLISNNK